jgi:hypothetical protein
VIFSFESQFILQTRRWYHETRHRHLHVPDLANTRNFIISCRELFYPYSSIFSLSLIHIVLLLSIHLSIPMGLHEHAGAGVRLQGQQPGSCRWRALLRHQAPWATVLVVATRVRTLIYASLNICSSTIWFYSFVIIWYVASDLVRRINMDHGTSIKGQTQCQAPTRVGSGEGKN